MLTYPSHSPEGCPRAVGCVMVGNGRIRLSPMLDLCEFLTLKGLVYIKMKLMRSRIRKERVTETNLTLQKINVLLALLWCTILSNIEMSF